MRTSASCDNKRSPSSLRCSVRGSRGLKQKHSDVKTLRTQMSLPSRHNAPTPLKRLSSLKVLSRSNNITMGDDQSRGLVRRYKSLSDICYWLFSWTLSEVHRDNIVVHPTNPRQVGHSAVTISCLLRQRRFVFLHIFTNFRWNLDALTKTKTFHGIGWASNR